MGIFDGIEKLFNEHGSSVILKERLALTGRWASWAAAWSVLLLRET